MYRRKVTLWGFFRRRLWRLLPIHLAALALGFIFYIERPDFSWPNFALNLGMMSQFFGIRPLNGVSWSAGYELYVPLVLVLVLASLKQLSARTALLLGMAFLIACMVAALMLSLGNRIDVLRAPAGLGLGFVIYHWQVSSGRNVNQLPRFVLPVLTCVMFAGMLFTGISPLFAVSLPVLAVLLVLFGTSSTSILSAPLFGWLGAISYSLYMVHVPILHWFEHYAENGVAGNMLLKAVMIMVSLAVASVLTYTIERPAIRLGKKRNRMTVQAATGSSTVDVPPLK